MAALRGASGAGHPEARLLLLAARNAVDAEASTAMRAAAREDLDWDWLIDSALEHGVMPAVHRNLTTHCAEQVPAGVVTKLGGEFRANALRNLAMAAKLQEVIQGFTENDIAVLPFKGPILTRLLYDDLAARQFSDLDILVRERDAARAIDSLRSRGYQLRQADPVEHGTAILKHTDSGLVIDLQWCLSSYWIGCPMDVDLIWARAIRCSENARMFQMRPEDQVLFLCWHGTKHGWSKLFWLRDLDAFTRRHQASVDWDETLQRAARSGSTRMLMLGFYLARELFATSPPAPMHGHTDANSSIAKVGRRVRDRLASGGKVSGMGTMAQLYDCAVGTSDSSVGALAARIRMVQQVLRPRKHDREYVRLPKTLSGLYPLVRLFRLVAAHGFRALRQRAPG